MSLCSAILLPLDVTVDVLDVAHHECLVVDCYLVCMLHGLHVLGEVLRLH